MSRSFRHAVALGRHDPLEKEGKEERSGIDVKEDYDASNEEREEEEDDSGECDHIIHLVSNPFEFLSIDEEDEKEQGQDDGSDDDGAKGEGKEGEKGENVKNGCSQQKLDKRKKQRGHRRKDKRRVKDAIKLRDLQDGKEEVEEKQEEEKKKEEIGGVGAKKASFQRKDVFGVAVEDMRKDNEIRRRFGSEASRAMDSGRIDGMSSIGRGLERMLRQEHAQWWKWVAKHRMRWVSWRESWGMPSRDVHISLETTPLGGVDILKMTDEKRDEDDINEFLRSRWGRRLQVPVEGVFTADAHYNDILQQLALVIESHDPDRLMALYSTFPFHMKVILQVSDMFDAMNERERAQDFIERAVATMQMAISPGLVDDLMQGVSVFIDPRRVENVVFYNTMVRYAHILARRGCPYTALSYARVVMSAGGFPLFDPGFLALSVGLWAVQAGEYQWFESFCKAIESSSKNASLVFIPNIAFPRALCAYFLRRATEPTPSDIGLEEATDDGLLSDRLLHRALSMFPSLSYRLLVEMECGAVLQRRFFKERGSKETVMMERLGDDYIRRHGDMWKKDQNVRKWAEEIAKKVCDAYDTRNEVFVEHMRQRIRFDSEKDIIQNYIQIHRNDVEGMFSLHSVRGMSHAMGLTGLLQAFLTTALPWNTWDTEEAELMERSMSSSGPYERKELGMMQHDDDDDDDERSEKR
eukprot:TRINITY_DN1304_c0_g1_i4.p1 TRINITY_DN1304_c0_g1~~TRINITY_DN1304_c0_g1_i4.p1  ORF type:complete len:695 (-),score=238.13 TRINITY_DN1304_c0_g1_i4:48-2132(-)